MTDAPPPPGFYYARLPPGCHWVPEAWGLLFNPMRGACEERLIAAQFTSRERAEEYLRLSALPQPETEKGNNTIGGAGPYPREVVDWTWHFSFREDSVLRWFNPPYGDDVAVVRLNFLDGALPVDPPIPDAWKVSA